MIAKRMPAGRYAKTGSMPAFKCKKVNWYWDVRLWSPVFLLILAIVIASKPIAPEISFEEIPADAGMTSLVTQEEAEPIEETEAPIIDDVISLARLADSVAAGRSAEVKKIIMWVAINRSEDRRNGYGLSLQEEIARPKQWQQYDPDGVYLEETVHIAEEVYETWKTGGARPLYGDMLWFVLNGDGSITVRNQFKAGKNRSEVTFGQ